MSESVFGESPAGIGISADNLRARSNFCRTPFYTRFQVQQMKAVSGDWMILAALVCSSYFYADILSVNGPNLISIPYGSWL